MQKKFSRFNTRFGVKYRRRMKTLRFASRHPFTVPIVTFVALVAVAVGVFLFLNRDNAITNLDSRIVIISHDHQIQTVPSHEQTVGQLVKKLGIHLESGDVIEPSPSTRINQDDFRINIYRAVPVEVVDNGHRTFTFSAATTPRSIVAQAGITAYADDALNTEPVTNFVAQHAVGERVVIDRATPVALNLYGTPLNIRTHAKTVGELIKDKKIKLGNGDTVVPTADTPIAPNQQVLIVRNGTKIATETQVLTAPVQTINDASLAYGTTAVRQQGSAGQQVATYQINIQNGVEVGRTLIQNVITQQPVTQIVVRGTNLGGIKGDMALAGISPNDYTYADYIISHESGWNPAAQNASGAFGLCQALPGGKMASAGADWATNPVTQLRWCNSYAAAHYGGWAAAYNFWLSHRYW